MFFKQSRNEMAKSLLLDFPNKTTMPPIEVIANCELCVTGYTCGHTDGESASGHTALH